jgi:hypothetical protein
MRRSARTRLGLRREAKRHAAFARTKIFRYLFVARPPKSAVAAALCRRSPKSLHSKLTCRFQGRDFRLTDVHGELVKKLLA